jgi:hypothetical protein
LRAEIASCDVLLAVIGPRWLDISDEQGNRRLDDPSDFVRIEISTALQRGIPVIPILLNGTKIPSSHRLPPDMKDLAVRNGLEVRLASFHSDISRLVPKLSTTGVAHTIAAIGSEDLVNENTEFLPNRGKGRPCRDDGDGEFDRFCASVRKSDRDCNIEPPASPYAIMRRAYPYRGKNSGPGKDDRWRT